MKQLILVRHAKSDSSVSGINDIERPLSDRGYKDAQLVSNSLIKENIVIDEIISSPAVRAYSTALIFAATQNIDPSKIVVAKELYEAKPEDYMNLIAGFDESLNSIAIFAHNPAISNMVSFLTGTMPNDLPTCSVSILQAEGLLWINVGARKFKLQKQIFPDHLT